MKIIEILKTNYTSTSPVKNHVKSLLTALDQGRKYGKNEFERNALVIWLPDSW